MRLLLVADLHYSLPQYDWVLEMAPDFDVVVIAGDHLDVASLVDGRAQSVVIRKYFNRLREKTRLLICSGNHDLDLKNEAGEKIAKWLGTSQNEGVLSDGESVVIDETLFTICPWWDGPIVREGIAAQLAEAAAKRAGQWIWIHHAPPAQSPTSWGGARFFGDVELREWIERYKPDIVMSGHVHQSPFIPDGSWVIALAIHGCSMPAISPGRCRPTSSSTPRRMRRFGFRQSPINSSGSISRWSGR